MGIRIAYIATCLALFAIGFILKVPFWLGAIIALAVGAPVFIVDSVLRRRKRN